VESERAGGTAFAAPIVERQAFGKVARDERGAIYVEFLIAFIPIFIFFLCIVQLAFLGAGQLVVAHSATRAVRAAMVVLDDERDFYDGASLGELEGHGTSNDVLHAIASLVDTSGGFPPAGPAAGSARLQAIRNAAYVPLATLAPSPAFLPHLAGAWITSRLGTLVRFGFGFAVYNRAAAMVSLREAPGSPNVVSGELNGPIDVTVHVTYLFPCLIPLANIMVCDDMIGLLGLRSTINAVGDALSSGSSPTDTAAAFEDLADQSIFSEEQQLVRQELGRAELPWLTYSLAFTDYRFSMLQAEATLPNQYAVYSDE
jgi:hypothetical protein